MAAGNFTRQPRGSRSDISHWFGGGAEICTHLGGDGQYMPLPPARDESPHHRTGGCPWVPVSKFELRKRVEIFVVPNYVTVHKRMIVN